MSINRAAVRELECFVAVAEELNFSRAAGRLHLSQPPLSRQIQSLEDKLGVRLLNRNTRSVSLTPAGALYLDDARQILTRLDAAAAAAGRAERGEAARVRLAFVGALLDEKLVGVLQAFRRLHPGCQIHLEDLPPSAQLEALEAGRVDGAFVGAEPRKLRRGVSTVVWKRERLLIALPERHPLAKARSVVLSQFTQDDWVMVSRVAAPAFRQQFDGLCRKAGLKPRVVQESERVGAVMTMVAAGQGISLMAEAVSRLVHPGVVFRPIAAPTPMIGHAFAYRGAEGSKVVQDLIGLLLGVRRDCAKRS